MGPILFLKTMRNTAWEWNWAVTQRRSQLADMVKKAMDLGISDDLKEAFNNWLENMDDGKKSREFGRQIIETIELEITNPDVEFNPVLMDILDRSDYLTKKSIWIFGGDGWAYDIGYGGLDHVIASGHDINILGPGYGSPIPTPGARHLNPLPWGLWPNLPPAANPPVKKIWE